MSPDVIERQFREAMAGRGLIAPRTLAIGRVARCPVVGKPDRKDGAYLLHLDGVPNGWIDNHTDGRGVQKWKPRGWQSVARISPSELKKKADTKALSVDKERAATRARAALIWNKSTPSAGTEYTQKKGIKAYGARTRRIGEAEFLVLGAYDARGRLNTLQFINSAGNKNFLKGGNVTGCFFIIGKIKNGGTICICEGYATGASIHEATGHAVAVAFSCGNLAPAARAIREKYPAAEIIICADRDEAGKKKAEELLRELDATNARLCLPVFSKEPEEGGANYPNDFNDLHQLEGLESIRKCLAFEVTPRPALSQKAGGQ